MIDNKLDLYLNEMNSMAGKKAKLFVTTMEQKILFYEEIQGQLSDGYWENTNPKDHWKFWSNIQWENIKVVSKSGVIGKPMFQKDNYNLTNKQLIDIVSDRMIMSCNLYRKLKDKLLLLVKNGTRIPESITDFNSVKSKANKGDKYYVGILDKWQHAGITEELMQEIEDKPLYKKSDLMKDLKALKLAFKTKLDKEPAPKKVVKVTSNRFEYETVVFTGFRNKEWEELIKQNGGEIGGGITKKTTLLIVKARKKPTGKILKAQQQGVKIMTKDEFENMYLG